MGFSYVNSLGWSTLLPTSLNLPASPQPLLSLSQYLLSYFITLCSIIPLRISLKFFLVPLVGPFIIFWTLYTLNSHKYTKMKEASIYIWEMVCSIYISENEIPYIIKHFTVPLIFLQISSFHFALWLNKITLYNNVSDFLYPFICLWTSMLILFLW